MKKIFPIPFWVIAALAFAAPKVDLNQLQGAWWSDLNNPTADFAIRGNEVWLDFDSQYHPFRIENDVLIFELGGDLGNTKQRIVSIDGDQLVLESLDAKKRTIYTRKEKLP